MAEFESHKFRDRCGTDLFVLAGFTCVLPVPKVISIKWVIMIYVLPNTEKVHASVSIPDTCVPHFLSATVVTESMQ